MSKYFKVIYKNCCAIVQLCRWNWMEIQIWQFSEFCRWSWENSLTWSCCFCAYKSVSYGGMRGYHCLAHWQQSLNVAITSLGGSTCLRFYEVNDKAKMRLRHWTIKSIPHVKKKTWYNLHRRSTKLELSQNEAGFLLEKHLI